MTTRHFRFGSVAGDEGVGLLNDSHRSGELAWGSCEWCPESDVRPVSGQVAHDVRSATDASEGARRRIEIDDQAIRMK